MAANDYQFKIKMLMAAGCLKGQVLLSCIIVEGALKIDLCLIIFTGLSSPARHDASVRFV